MLYHEVRTELGTRDDVVADAKRQLYPKEVFRLSRPADRDAIVRNMFKRFGWLNNGSGGFEFVGRRQLEIGEIYRSIPTEPWLA